MSLPNYLPDILKLEGEYNDIIDKAYEIFKRDFIDNTTKYDGVPVIYDKRIIAASMGKKVGFWHLISKEMKPLEGRFLDKERAQRLPWIKPLIEREFEGVLHFEYDEGSKDKGIRTYIWLKDYDYLVVLKKRGNVYILITAYCILSSTSRHNIQRRYENRL